MSDSARKPDREWPALKSLQCDLAPVAPFDARWLPITLRTWAVDISERMQVPLDLPAIALILALAGTVSRHATIQPKRFDTGWVVVPNLYGGFVTPPGYMKTPVISAVVKPLEHLEEEFYQEYLMALEGYEAKGHNNLTKPKEAIGFEPWATEGYYTKRSEKGEKPVWKRILANDATFEKLHEILSQNPAGVLVVRDELGAWMAALDQKGREGERGFYLIAWNGDSYYVLDRIGRGTKRGVICLSVLGGIQPESLANYMATADLAVDGLIQRFQLLVYPDMGQPYTPTDRLPDAEAQENVAKLFRSLAFLESVPPLTARFTEDAQVLFTIWFDSHEERLRGTDEVPVMIQHLAKYRSLVPSLTLLLELADVFSMDAFGGFEALKGNPFYVGLESVQRAIEICWYLESHAKRIYSVKATAAYDAAKALAERIRPHNIAANGKFTSHDVSQKGWKGLSTPSMANSAIEILVAHNWIRVRDSEPGANPVGGRPTTQYEVSPRIWEQQA